MDMPPLRAAWAVIDLIELQILAFCSKEFLYLCQKQLNQKKPQKSDECVSNENRIVVEVQELE